MSSNQVAILEQYVESTTHMPSELQRLLATIRDLDEKTRSLLVEVRQDVERCLDLVPQSSWKSPNGEQYKEVAELRSSIERRQVKLVQMAEEKVQLSVQCYEYVDTSLANLNSNMQEFDDDAKEEAEAGEPNGEGGSVLTPVDVTPMASQRRPPASHQAAKKQAEKVPEKKMRERERDGDAALPPSKAARRTQSQAQLQLPSLVEGLEDFFSSEPEKLDLAPHRANAASHLPPLHHPGQATPQPAAPHPVQLPQQAQQHMSPINRSGIEGLQAFSSQLQAAGSLLTHADISQELRGRHAELFWPDDNRWYVITIHDVNPMAKKARIMYTTGETEELDLNEIVREGHMSLINL